MRSVECGVQSAEVLRLLKKAKTKRRHSEGESPKNPLPGERVESTNSQKSKFFTNSLFLKFTDSTPSNFRGFFGRLCLPQNDGGNGKWKTEFMKICFFVNLKKHFCFAKSTSLVLAFYSLKKA